MKLLINITKKLKEIEKTGFLSLIISSFINKILGFSNGIILIRILNKEDYGVYSYYQNTLMIFLFMAGFGSINGFLQYGSKVIKREEKIEYFIYTLKYGMITDVILGISIYVLSFSKFLFLEGTINYLRYMCFFPLLTTLIESLLIKERIFFNNKKVAIMSNIRSVLEVIFLLFGSLSFGIIGVIFGRYISQILTIIIYIFLAKEDFSKLEVKGIGNQRKKEFIKFSFISLVNNLISQILYVMDIFLIGKLISDKLILANYKTATLIPFALNFLPILISQYMYPYFSRDSSNKVKIKNYYKKMLKYNGSFNLAVTLILILFSKYILSISFGKEYIVVQKEFTILMLGYFFAATFRIPGNSILSALGKVKYLVYNSLICAIINIIFDIIMIKEYGSYGAAMVTVLIFIISGGLANYKIIEELYIKKN